MRILIIGINYSPEPVGIGPYSTGMAGALAEAGHQVEVLTGKPYYPGWRIEPEWRRPLYRRSREGGVAVTRCPLYVPRRDSGLKRIIHHASFAATLLPVALRSVTRFKPELVINVAPSMISTPVARLIARLAGAKLWLHIQDFEVEAAFATGLLKPDSLLGRLARGFERNQLRAPDRVSTISPQMCDKLKRMGVAADRIIEFRNWADIDAIRPLTAPSPYRAEWAISTPFVALYSGNIANKQGIEIVVETAKLLCHRSDLTFVICGEGPNRANLEALAADLGNIRLHDLQPKARLGDLLGMATIHLLPQLGGAADLVLPSKLTNMLASGRPVIATAAPGTGLAEEIAGVGIVTPPEDAAALAGAIEQLIDDPQQAVKLGVAARIRAEERWSGKAILARFAETVTALAAGDGIR
jgi:colanic acid biosynthesis glycosyl transferase WcaI